MDAPIPDSHNTFSVGKIEDSKESFVGIGMLFVFVRLLRRIFSILLSFHLKSRYINDTKVSMIQNSNLGSSVC